jgi:hypothetical protein
MKNLWRAGGLSGIVAAVTVPLFVLAFYGLAPALGFDPSQFGDADQTLGFFAAQPFFIRSVGLLNLVTMTASILLMPALAFRLSPGSGGLAIVGGALGILAWLAILIGEFADLTAFVHLSQRYVAEPDLARTGFAIMVGLGRQARGWGYLLLALALAVLSIPIGRETGWPRALRPISLAIVPLAALLFIFDYVVLLDTNSGLFGAVFALAGVLLAVWNGWIGWRLWKEGR